MADNAFYHHDLESGVKRSDTFGAGKVGGELVFVPKSDDAKEADSWLMGLVIDTHDETIELQFFDALDIKKGSTGAIFTLHRIPPGFHGNWIPDS